MNRGSDKYREEDQQWRTASMRPRFMNRGSALDEALTTVEQAIASMRPRFMNRGSEAA